MIGVLLQAESPWQRNDAILFFIYFYRCVSLYQEFFLSLREYIPVIIASIMAKFEKIILERFRN